MKARIPNQGGMNQAAMLKKIQDMQADMENKQAEIEVTEFTASAGGGAVEAVVLGTHEVKRIKIDPEVIDPEDAEMLEDMVVAAVNEAIRKSVDAMESAMESAKAGLGGLGGLGGLF